MRKIEEKMLDAVKNKRNFKSGNTMVRSTKNGCYVVLYNTIIFAEFNGVKYYSDNGWSTNTTGSRLRALGADYSTNIKRNKCELQSYEFMQEKKRQILYL